MGLFDMFKKKDMQAKMLKVYSILRCITTVFAILGPIAMVGSAVAITLYEGDWWFNLFAFCFGAILMMAGTLYLSLVALMGEITRYIKNKVKSDLSDTPITKWVHRFLMGASIAGVISFIPFFLIFYDILNGGFAICHFICGGAIVVLYFVLGINAMIRRSMH